MTTEYIVMTAAAKMPSTCWGRYGKVAIAEVTKGIRPKMISERALGMVRIVELHDRLHAIGPGSAFNRTLAAAKIRCEHLNRERNHSA